MEFQFRPSESTKKLSKKKQAFHDACINHLNTPKKMHNQLMCHAAFHHFPIPVVEEYLKDVRSIYNPVTEEVAKKFGYKPEKVDLYKEEQTVRFKKYMDQVIVM